MTFEHFQKLVDMMFVWVAGVELHGIQVTSYLHTYHLITCILLHGILVA